MMRARLVALLGVLISVGQADAATTFPPDLVERGRYLAVAGDCTACHTAPAGGKPVAGG